MDDCLYHPVKSRTNQYSEIQGLCAWLQPDGVDPVEGLALFGVGGAVNLEGLLRGVAAPAGVANDGGQFAEEGPEAERGRP